MSYLPVPQILYWNCVLGKKAEIEKLSKSFDIIFLAETCIKVNHDFRIRGFDCLRMDANMADIRGMIVLIRNPIIYSFLDLSSMIDCSFEALGIKIPFNNSHLFLIGVYRHSNVRVSNFAISALTSFVADHHFSILLGDFNAHHPMWGGTRSNRVGRALVECINEQHLVVLNPPSSPTYLSFFPYYTSTINLIIASPHISSFCEALVLPDLHGSEVRVNCLVKTTSVFSYKIKLSKTQWEEGVAPTPVGVIGGVQSSRDQSGSPREEVKHYLINNSKIISQTVNSIPSDDPITQYNTFLALIAVSYERFSPLKPPLHTRSSRSTPSFRGPPPAPWWTPDCTEAIRNRGSALRVFKHNPSLDNYIYYRSVVSQSYKILRRTKRAGWKAHPHMLLTIYRSRLRASIEYSAHIFGTMTNERTRALQVIQNHALRLCFGYCVSTPLNVVHAEAMELFLPLRFHLFASRYFLKISSVTDHPVVLKLYELCDLAAGMNNMNYLHAHFPAALLFQQMQIFRNIVDRSYTLPNFRHSFSSSFISCSYSSLSTPSLETLDHLPNPCAQAAFDQEFSHLTAVSTVFYTVGSKVDHSTHVGAAVLIPQLQGELMYKLSSYTSIFSAEAFAIYNAITTAIDPQLSKAMIVTDSRSVLEAIKGTCIRTNNYLILLIKARLEEAENEGTCIQFI
ncbi:hypothetical protein ALC57_14595 [Trachymyrmex cornetzi]|uniref:Endonuclease/exonuclease/phosphatase domain-containing protein n=1 Tax=Trachymyrmex cornetzi TaxID=471704 RepID=A0A151IY91_9HYME|nr:hypothetical protein ALC57_14595 [Trachymyrmex cornetzi]